jgi:hypothetical protein
MFLQPGVKQGICHDSLNLLKLLSMAAVKLISSNQLKSLHQAVEQVIHTQPLFMTHYLPTEIWTNHTYSMQFLLPEQELIPH